MIAILENYEVKFLFISLIVIYEVNFELKFQRDPAGFIEKANWEADERERKEREAREQKIRREIQAREERDQRESNIFHFTRRGNFNKVKSLLEGGWFSKPIRPNIRDEVCFNKMIK